MLMNIKNKNIKKQTNKNKKNKCICF